MRNAETRSLLGARRLVAAKRFRRAACTAPRRQRQEYRDLR